ncbi:MAG: rod shape-determining protein MreD [Fibrobacterota bacterium]
MIILKWILYFTLAIVLQSTIVSQISIHGVYPNAVLILLFILAIEHGRLAGIWAGFFVGLIIDLYSGDTLGVHALSNTVVGAFVGIFSRDRFNTGPVFQIIILVAAAIIHNFIYSFMETEGLTAAQILVNAVPAALYTGIISSVLLFTIHYLIPNKRR